MAHLLPAGKKQLSVRNDLEKCLNADHAAAEWGDTYVGTDLRSQRFWIPITRLSGKQRPVPRIEDNWDLCPSYEAEPNPRCPTAVLTN